MECSGTLWTADLCWPVDFIEHSRILFPLFFKKVTKVTDWFTSMIVVANHDNVEVRKKLLLEKDLKLDTATAVCKEEEKAAKTSCMLGTSHTSGKAGAYQAHARESAAGMSSYQSSHGSEQQWGRRAPRGGQRCFHRDWGRSPLFAQTICNLNNLLFGNYNKWIVLERTIQIVFVQS